MKTKCIRIFATILITSMLLNVLSAPVYAATLKTEVDSTDTYMADTSESIASTTGEYKTFATVGPGNDFILQAKTGQFTLSKTCQMKVMFSSFFTDGTVSGNVYIEIRDCKNNLNVVSRLIVPMSMDVKTYSFPGTTRAGTYLVTFTVSPAVATPFYIGGEVYCTNY